MAFKDDNTQRAYFKAYGQRPEVKEARRKWYAANKERVKQQRAVRGEIIKQQGIVRRQKEKEVDITDERAIAKKTYMREYRARHHEHLQEIAKRYRIEHKEELLVSRRAWRAKNSERLNEAGRDYYQRNKDTIQGKHAMYRKENPEVFTKAGKRYRQSEKGKTYHKNWRIGNAAKIKTYQKKSCSREEAKQRAAAYQREYRKTAKYKAWQADNVEKFRQYSLAHYYRNREMCKEFQQLYGGCYPRRVAIYAKLNVCGNICYICGQHLDAANVVMEHVIPKTAGGTNDISNLMPAHSICNGKKGSKTNYPVARPDLIELALSITAPARKPSKKYAWKDKHKAYLDVVKFGLVQDTNVSSAAGGF